MLKTVREWSILLIEPISPFVGCSLIEQDQGWIGGLCLGEYMMQRRFGLDLEVPDEFGIGFAWYVTGEGCFMANIWTTKRKRYKQLYTRFIITIRADDIDGLHYIQKILGVGYVRQRAKPTGSSPMADYCVTRIADLYHVIVPLFEQYPLPSQWRKAKDFEIWKRVVEIQYLEGGQRGRGSQYGSFVTPQSFWDKVEPLVDALKKGRKYPS